MFSGVIAWFFKSLLGIEPTEDSPAFERIELRPHFIKDARYAHGKLETVRGEIELSWEYKNGGFEYTVTLPEGIDAEYNGKRLNIGKNIFIIEEA